MAKAVLVMNMPESCGECPFCRGLNECKVKKYLVRDRLFTIFTVDAQIMEGGKPSWCPLRELPEKKKSVYPQECYDNSYWPDEMRAGWNACLDMILEKKVNENVMPGTRNEKRTEGAQENEKRK